MISEDTLLEPGLDVDEVPRRQHVLIIDDDRDQVEVLAFRMASQGFRPIMAHSAREGLDAARRQRPDLIILDVRLPDGDGLNVCQQLMDDPQTCNIPVIILSGMEHPEIIRNARAAGCTFYLRKPYDPNALLLLATTAIEEHGSW